MRFDDDSSELNHLQFGRCVIYLYLMGESSSRVLDRDVSNLDTEFENCVLLNFLENSVMKVLVSILLYFLYLIFIMGRVGLGELIWKNTK